MAEHFEGAAGTGGGAGEGEGQQLLGQVPPEVPHWPSWWKKYLNDFLPAKRAKPNDGMRSPQFGDQPWATSPGATTEVVLEAARRRHDQAEARTALAEQRAERLAQRALTLLALAFVLVGSQASTLKTNGAPWWLWLVAMGVGGFAIAMLTIAAIQAIGVDRVGYAQPADPGEAAVLDEVPAQRRALASQEIRAAEMANWTARNKVNEFLQARAWLTRGITALILSATCGVGIWTTTARTTTPAPPADTSPSDDGDAPATPSTRPAAELNTTTSGS